MIEDEHILINWFDQMVIKACLTGAQTVVFIAITGDGDDDGILACWVLPEARRYLVAVHARKPQVQEHEFGSESRAVSIAVGPSYAVADFMPQDFQQPQLALGQIHVVVDYEDSGPVAVA